MDLNRNSSIGRAIELLAKEKQGDAIKVYNYLIENKAEINYKMTYSLALPTKYNLQVLEKIFPPKKKESATLEYLYLNINSTLELFQLIAKNEEYKKELIERNALKNFIHYHIFLNRKNKDLLSITNFLLDIGCSIDVSNLREKYTTLLEPAVRIRDIDLVRLLVERKAKINDFNKSGVTPFFTACKSNFHEAVFFLLAHKANPFPSVENVFF